MNKYIESETLELKERYTDTISKEIVSFLNSSGGTILIGIKDDGTVIGVNNIDEVLRKISDIITAQIEPNPQDEITSELKFDEGKTVIAVHHDLQTVKEYFDYVTFINVSVVASGHVDDVFTEENIEKTYKNKSNSISIIQSLKKENTEIKKEG